MTVISTEKSGNPLAVPIINPYYIQTIMNITPEELQAHLDYMVAEGFVNTHLDENGEVIYTLAPEAHNLLNIDND